MIGLIAVICAACWCSRAWLLAKMVSAARAPNSIAANDGH
jgi:hypothetical protein